MNPAVIGRNEQASDDLGSGVREGGHQLEIEGVAFCRLCQTTFKRRKAFTGIHWRFSGIFL
ncbi:MAG: hypothetical protein ABIS50_15055 [Luteolibacter sp.]